MTIHDISVRNFRGIAYLDRLRCGSINSFTGKNDSGKSSIIKALDAFFNKNITQADIYKGSEEGAKVSINIRFSGAEDFHPLATDCEDLVSITREFEFSSKGKMTMSEYYTCEDFEENNDCWAQKEAGLNSRLQNEGLPVTKSGSGVTNLSKVEALYEHMKDRPRSDKKHDIGEYVKNMTKVYGSFEFPTFSMFEAEANLDESATNFQKQFKAIVAESIEGNKELTDQLEENVRDDLEEEFNEITTFMRKNVPDLEQVKPNVVSSWGNLMKFDLSLKFAGDNFEVPLSHRGTGFKRLLMVAYFEYLASRVDKQHHYFAIEEPETFLHPSLQLDLLESIKSLSTTNQFFLTTHSPIFAGATPLDNIVVVRKEGPTSSYYIPQGEDERLNLVIKELGIRPDVNLLNGNHRKAVFVEGKGDCGFWKYALNKIEGTIPADIIFIPCGGDQIDYFVNTQLCRLLKRNFMIIVDSDKGAIDFERKAAAKEVLRQETESMGGKFMMIGKREIENYYHPAAIDRVLARYNKGPVNLTIDPFIDFKTLFRQEVVPLGTGMKAKNNLDIFAEMSKEEWLESAVGEPGSTDLEHIIQEILS